MSNETYENYTVALIVQSAIIMGVSYLIFQSVTTAAYVTAGVLALQFVVPYVFVLLAGLVVITVAWLVSIFNPPLEAPNEYSAAA